MVRKGDPNPHDIATASPSSFAITVGLAGYQEGAVVSRTLLKRAGGTITLFAFNEGQALSEHTEPFDAVALALEGEADITIVGTPLRVSAREMVLMPAQSAAQSMRTRGSRCC